MHPSHVIDMRSYPTIWYILLSQPKVLVLGLTIGHTELSARSPNHVITMAGVRLVNRRITRDERREHMRLQAQPFRLVNRRLTRDELLQVHLVVSVPTELATVAHITGDTYGSDADSADTYDSDESPSPTSTGSTLVWWPGRRITPNVVSLTMRGEIVDPDEPWSDDHSVRNSVDSDPDDPFSTNSSDGTEYLDPVLLSYVRNTSHFRGYGPR